LDWPGIVAEAADSRFSDDVPGHSEPGIWHLWQANDLDAAGGWQW
jgi:hypothetical protein